MFIKTKIPQILDYVYRIQKLIESVGKFSLLKCKSPKNEFLHKAFISFFKDFIKRICSRALIWRSVLSIIFWHHLYNLLWSLFCVFNFQLCDGNAFFRRCSNHRASMSRLILFPQKFFWKCVRYSHIVTMLWTLYSEALLSGHNIMTTIVLSPF